MSELNFIIQVWEFIFYARWWCDLCTWRGIECSAVLAVDPVIGAIAAGCTVCLKTSEVTPATSELLSTLVPKYLDNDAIKVVEGGVPEVTALLEQKWDKIFYTGGYSDFTLTLLQLFLHLSKNPKRSLLWSPCVEGMLKSTVVEFTLLQSGWTCRKSEGGENRHGSSCQTFNPSDSRAWR